jgi:hypothetical protein
MRFWIAITFGILVVAGTVHAGHIEQQAQDEPTPVIIDSFGPTALPFVEVTEIAVSPTWTATAVPAARLQALSEANVRAEPDPEAELLGVIGSDQQFVVTGRYFRWFRFEYADALSDEGWVFDELVQIIGDETSIRDLTLDPTPTPDPQVIGLTFTAEVIALTPGGGLTATANSNIVPLPIPPGVTAQITAAISQPANQILPTFTFPPNLPGFSPETTNEPTSIPSAFDTLIENLPDNSPPIIPLIALISLGVFGLVITATRR